MKHHDQEFFNEPTDPKKEARLLATEVIARLLIWMAEDSALNERGVRATVALYCIRPDLIPESTLEEIGNLTGRSKQAVHQIADSFRETTALNE